MQKHILVQELKQQQQQRAVIFQYTQTVVHENIRDERSATKGDMAF
jgi:hypothetical protein